MSINLNSLRIIALLLFSLVSGLIAVSNQSLWIDEASSAQKATADTFADFFQVLFAQKGSDMQMPLYMIWLWLWEKLFGHNEWILRAANLPWFLLAQAAILWGLRSYPRFSSIIAIICATSPFLWQYLDEARPYLMQYSGATLCLASITRALSMPRDIRQTDIVIPVLCLGVIVLCGATMIGLIILCFGGPFVMYGVWHMTDRSYWFSKKSLYYTVPTSMFLIILGIYYIWTLQQGAGAARMGSEGLASLLFACYEFIGFTGLGPGRYDMRLYGIQAFTPYLWKLALMAALLGLAALAALPKAIQLWRSHLSQRRHVVLFFTLGFVIPLVVMVIISHMTGFRLLGRHLIGFSIVILCFLGIILSILWGEGNKYLRFLVIVIISLFVVSSIEFRFAPRHKKDDYRGAVALAMDLITQGNTVGWAADPLGALYYNLPIQQKVGFALPVSFLHNLEAKDIPSDPRSWPEIIFLSKKDIFDKNGVIQDHLRAYNYKLLDIKLHSFEVWERPHHDSTQK